MILYLYDWMLPAFGILFGLVGLDILIIAPEEYRLLSLPFGLACGLYVGTWLLSELGKMIIVVRIV